MSENNGHGQEVEMQGVTYDVRDVKCVVPITGGIVVHLNDGSSHPLQGILAMQFIRPKKGPKLSVVRGGVVQ